MKTAEPGVQTASRCSDTLRLPGCDTATVQTVNVSQCRGPVLYSVYKTGFQILLMLHQSKAVEKEHKRRPGTMATTLRHKSYCSASGSEGKKERMRAGGTHLSSTERKSLSSSFEKL